MQYFLNSQTILGFDAVRFKMLLLRVQARNGLRRVSLTRVAAQVHVRIVLCEVGLMSALLRHFAWHIVFFEVNTFRDVVVAPTATPWIGCASYECRAHSHVFEHERVGSWQHECASVGACTHYSRC